MSMWIGEGGSPPEFPLWKIENKTEDATNDITAFITGVKFPGTIKELENGRFAVVDEDGNRIEVFDKEKEAEKFIERRRGDAKSVEPYLPSILEAGDKLVGQIDKLVENAKDDLKDEDKQLLDKLKKYKEQLLQYQDEADKDLEVDLKELNADLRKGVDLLNEKDKAAFQRQLTSFEKDSEKLVSTFKKDAESLISSGDEEQKATLKNYETEGLRLGDSYLKSTSDLTKAFDAAYESTLDLSPERLSSFTQAADFLSKTAQQTRRDMIAAADPRATELAAIADENAAAMMSGRISADTQANLARSSAMRALRGGFGASSGMGRGLAARDLGLTALDLQQQGFKNYQDQRRMIFDQQVSGLQADAGSLLLNDMTARQRQAFTNYEVGLGVAESDRNQRQSVFNTALAGNLARVSDRTQAGLSAAGTALNAGMDTNRTGFAAQLGERNARTARSFNTMTNEWDRMTQARVGTYNTGVGTRRSIYSTDVAAAGNIYTTNANAIYQNAGMRAGARSSVFDTGATARTNALGALVGARTNEAATMVGGIQRNWEAENARYAANVSNNNAMWGNIIQTGATIAGTAIGAVTGNPLAGYQIGSFAGSALAGNNTGQSMPSFTGALAGSPSSGVSMYSSFAAAQQAAPYSSIFTNDSGLGYTPVAMAV